jgi:spore germination cell wall hydrolase CwlJ-like protein
VGVFIFLSICRLKTGAILAEAACFLPFRDVVILIETLHRQARKAIAVFATSLGLVALVSACAPQKVDLTSAPLRQAVATGGLSDGALLKVSANMDPAMRSLAFRHDPGARHTDLWGRPQGWTSLDLSKTPDLGFDTAIGPSAEQLNEILPFAKGPIRPMRPFVLDTHNADDSARALHCLTQAVYYEAAREPEAGQAAVAQVVLNRVRHPAYPKSICGVVYQGSARLTGCQFTFTCDGSLRWAPEASFWARCQAVAKRALAGYVFKPVGSATHYHAVYVSPYWAPTLVKMAQVGQQIFYRWTGPWGEPPAFTGRYEGREAYLTPALLGSIDPRTQGGRESMLDPEGQGVPGERMVTLAVAGEVRTYTIADPTTASGQRTRVLGAILPSRRQPTADEVKRINDSLAALDMGGAEKPAKPTAAKGSTTPGRISSATPATATGAL